MNNLVLGACHDRALVQLTEREIEILKWTAVGKTADDIALILSMKKRTVHFHVANAVQKMGVCNKTAAVVQAALSGMF
jgi:DNA-binding CsgD family transcriptional regulator